MSSPISESLLNEIRERCCLMMSLELGCTPVQQSRLNQNPLSYQGEWHHREYTQTGILVPIREFQGMDLDSFCDVYCGPMIRHLVRHHQRSSNAVMLFVGCLRAPEERDKLYFSYSIYSNPEIK